MIESYACGLASDKPDLSEAEARLIEIAQIARGATMLVLAECARSGFVRKEGFSWDLAPGAKELAKFLSIERASLQTLGLGRRAKPAGSLPEFLETFAREAERPDEEPPQNGAP